MAASATCPSASGRIPRKARRSAAPTNHVDCRSLIAMIRIQPIRVALVIATMFTAVAMPSAQTARPAAAVSDVPRLPFETYTLPNGLQVIFSQDRRLPLVAVNLWYHVGPANEEPGRTGF